MRTEKPNSEDSSNKSKFFLRRKDLKRLQERSLKEKESFVKSKRRLRDKRGEEIGRLKNKRDLNTSDNLRMRSTSLRGNQH